MKDIFNANIAVLISRLLTSPDENLARDINALYERSPEQTIRFFDYHEITPTVALRLKPYKHLLSLPLQEALTHAFHTTIQRTFHYEQHFKKVHTLLTQAGIRCVPLKGIAFFLASLPSICARPMSDIDLLIPEESFASCDTLLREQGYDTLCPEEDQTYWRTEQMHMAYRRSHNECPQPVIEVHWRLDYPRAYTQLPALWERTTRTEINGMSVEFLSPEDQLFSLALHQRRFGKPLPLKYVCDVARIVSTHHDSIDIDYLRKESVRSRVAHTLHFLCWQVSQYTDSTVLRDMLRAVPTDKLRKKVMKRIADRVLYPRSDAEMKTDFFSIHLISYDSFIEAIHYIAYIPYNQFCRYFNLHTPTTSAKLAYRYRFLLYIWIALRHITQQCYWSVFRKKNSTTSI